MAELTSKYISNKAWNRYKKIVQKFLNLDAGRQKVFWMQHVDQMLAFAEDSTPQFVGIEIEALCFYNAFRNWPLNKATVSGALDEENLSIYISKSAIEELGYLNSDGYWNFNWEEDRFVINGIVYKPSGDTQVAQAKDEPLVFMVILKRDRDTVLCRNILNQLADIQGIPVLDINGGIILGKP